MIELFDKIISTLLYITLFSAFIFIVPNILIVIFHIIFDKKLPKILLNNYIELSDKITIANNYKGGNNPKSKHWIETQLIWKYFRHFDFCDNGKLKKIQRIYKIFYIIQMGFFVVLIICGWCIGLTIFRAFITFLIEKESVNLIIITGFFAINITCFGCVLLTKFVVKLIKFY